MGLGMRKLTKNIIVGVTLFIAFFVFSADKASAAVQGLNFPRDTINTGNPEAYAQHLIKFGLPLESLQVSAGDYILIDFPFYSSLTEPTFLSGSFTGNPVFSVIDKRIRITGIELLPGKTLQINGINAYNPANRDEYDVYIRISSDPDGIVTRNMAQIIATPTDNSVSVSATIMANVGTLKVTGYAAPGLFLTFSENGTIIGTTTGTPTGTFSQIFPGINPVQHTIIIFGTDSVNRTTSPVTIEAFTRVRELTIVSGVLMPPTMSIDKDQITQGESLTISGMGVPGHMIIIYTQPAPDESYQTAPELDGAWSHTITDTSSFEIGVHSVWAIDQDIFGGQSLYSRTLDFRVTQALPPNPGPPCDIEKGDLSCDLLVNIVDFSILLYYWGTNNGVADINADGSVNLIDFSVMMFYWQG
ncbi:MAG: hypothetical protein UT18_C0009G0058 [candidate division CPR2 bacterium GW2011_GWC2_39_10]|uniref:Dockerin domain-containing protein n=1 Tax=candidate division CPR2 bacterium GW2011_GWC2_39_10 TaxID=1618345 RepID=A0A0G0LUG1_UNCC2|nr:MAG: hypothetical protein UT18_C0009G0058 [candidate division CPR2 bacterium GW2011_GWC2_39_10]